MGTLHRKIGGGCKHGGAPCSQLSTGWGAAEQLCGGKAAQRQGAGWDLIEF
jgi:hypothetical protein